MRSNGPTRGRLSDETCRQRLAAVLERVESQSGFRCPAPRPGTYCWHDVVAVPDGSEHRRCSFAVDLAARPAALPGEPTMLESSPRVRRLRAGSTRTSRLQATLTAALVIVLLLCFLEQLP